MKLLPALALLSCATVATTGSLYRGRCTHAGIRPATDGSGVAVTIQITSDFPRCPK